MMTKAMKEHTEQNELAAKAFLDQIAQHQLMIQTYHEEIETIKRTINAAASFPQLHAINASIITMNKKIELLFVDQMGTNIKSSLKTMVQNNPMLSNLIHFYEEALQLITRAKERISTEELLNSLPKEKKTVLNHFFQELKTLGLMNDEILIKKQHFQQSLKQAKTLSEVDQIENEIINANNGLGLILKANLHYPKEQPLLTKLEQFLETNYHLAQVISAFDLYESLNDDILNARALHSHSIAPKI